MSGKVGAPKGGRVHWLLFHLTPEFKGAYELYYNYKVHNYVFLRHHGRAVYDIFVVIHTSKHWWHCVYACPEKGKYERFGYRNTRIIAEIMLDIYTNDRDGVVQG